MSVYELSYLLFIQQPRHNLNKQMFSR